MSDTSPVVHAGAPPGGFEAFMTSPFPMLIVMIAIFYFLLIRPQQKRMKEHRDMVASLQRGDVVVTSGGLIGKIHRVQDEEVTIEVAENVRVRAVRGTISEVRSKTTPTPANDAKND